jgi:hypothetical protein
MATQPAVLGTARLGNFRLNYVAEALAPVRVSRIRILIGGAPARVRRGSVTIHESKGQPGTCRLTVDAATPPVENASLRITINSDAPRLLFAGELQTTDVTYEGRPEQIVYPCTAIDDTGRANARLPFGSWTNVSATTVAQELVAQFVAGFSAAYVQAGLPAITINLDGSEGMEGALTQIDKLIGGYHYWEDAALHLFTDDDGGDTPDDLDRTPNRFLDAPPITMSVDYSQVRTRNYGMGHGEATMTDVAALETILPIADVTMFNVSGGLAICLTQRLAYTGVQAGGGGSLVGPGAAPSASPIGVTQVGTGVEVGDHYYSVTFVTLVGESAAPPPSVVAVGTLAAPATAPTPGAPVSGGSVDSGSHVYQTTFVTAAGETPGSPISAPVTTYTVPPSPVTPPATAPTAAAPLATGVLTGGVSRPYQYAVTFETSTGETTASPVVSQAAQDVIYGGIVPSVVAAAGGTLVNGSYGWGIGQRTARGDSKGNVSGGSAVTIGAGKNQLVWTIPAAPFDPRITHTLLYRTKSGGAGPMYLVAAVPVGSTSYTDNVPDGSLTLAEPSIDGCQGGRIDLANIPTSADGRVTHRKLYRTVANGTQLKFLTTLSNNTATTYTDSIIPDASLGANVPTSDTTGGAPSVLQTVPVVIAVGPSGVTARRLYRTAVGGSQFKLAATIADNVTTSVTDALADASLGATIPTVNTTVAAQVALSAISIGGAAVTARKVYRTAANGAQLQLLTTLADNVTTTFLDTAPDASLGANVPTSDTSGLAQPPGQVLAGAPSLIVASSAAFAPAGGWAVIGNGQLVIRYTSVIGNALIGIPPAGPGAIVASIGYNSTATAAPALTGVTGVGLLIIKGSPVNIWVQRDDLAAQAELAARESTASRPSDGIREYRIVDERRGEASLRALCDADLLQFSRGIRTVPYASRDVKTKAGKPIVIDLPSPPITETLTIQEVTIDQIDEFDGLPPRYTVTASNFRHSLEDILRRVAAGLGGL